jgi:hypothetical protein
MQLAVQQEHPRVREVAVGALHICTQVSTFGAGGARGIPRRRTEPALHFFAAEKWREPVLSRVRINSLSLARSACASVIHRVRDSPPLSGSGGTGLRQQRPRRRCGPRLAAPRRATARHSSGLYFFCLLPPELYLLLLPLESRLKTAYHNARPVWYSVQIDGNGQRQL